MKANTDWESDYSSSSAIKQSRKTLRKIKLSGTFVLSLLTSSTVVVIVSKWVALVWRKTDFSQSIWPAGNQRNHCVYNSKLLWTWVLKEFLVQGWQQVNLKIPHPFKYPGLRVMSSEQTKNSFTNCSPC